MNYLIIHTFHNSYGRGCSIETRNPGEHNMTYYNYSLREAEKRFREKFGYKGRHFTKIYI